MTSNSISPAYVQLNYTSNGHPHKALYPCSYDGSVSPGLEPDVTRRVGAAEPVSAAVAALVALLKPFMDTTATFDNFYAYSKPTPTSAPVLIWTGALAVAGTSGTAVVPAEEIMFTFKTPAPGGLKLYLMEATFALNYRAPLPTTGASPQAALNNYICGPNDWIIGRNGNFPLIGLNITTKMNDHLRRKYIL